MSDVETLRNAAGHYYEACLLWEDEDLDPGDHMEVLRRAFLSSNCDDFALALSRATGWDTVRMDWLTRAGEAGHHALVRAPDGRLLDAAGWTDARSLARRYGARASSTSLCDGGAVPQALGEVDDAGIDPELARIVGVIRALPHEPFREAWFRELASRPVEGADVPEAGTPAP